MQERDGHDPLGHEPGRLGRVGREARVGGDVGEDERLAGAEHPAGDAGAGREAAPDQGVLALADDGLEDQLVGGLVEQQHAGRAGVEDRPRHLDDRLEQGAVGAVVGEHPRRDRRRAGGARQPSAAPRSRR